VPTVELRAATGVRHNFPSVLNHSRAIGRLVADHFLERRFSHFGVCTYSPQSNAISSPRWEAIAHAAKADEKLELIYAILE